MTSCYPVSHVDSSRSRVEIGVRTRKVSGDPGLEINEVTPDRRLNIKEEL